MRDRIAMLVEDEPILMAGYRAALEAAGYKVQPFGSVDEALPHLEREVAYCLVVSDIQTPGHNDGRVLIEQARRLHPEARVIGMSSRGKEIMNGCNLEPHVFLRKPFSLQELTFQANQ